MPSKNKKKNNSKKKVPASVASESSSTNSKVLVSNSGTSVSDQVMHDLESILKQDLNSNDVDAWTHIVCRHVKSVLLKWEEK